MEREVVNPYGYYVWIEMKSGVVLMSEGGPEVTTLLYSSEFAGFAISCSSITDAVVQGFTIGDTGCYVRSMSGYLDEGISISSSGVLVEDNIVYSFRYGIAVYGVGEGPTKIRNCHISYCEEGIDCGNVPSNADLAIENNTITNCNLGIWCYDAAPTITGNLITQSFITGIEFWKCSPALLTRNVLTENGHYGLVIVTDVFCEPYFAGTFLPADGNEINDNGDYDVYSGVDDPRSVTDLRMTYWGTLCPDPSKIVAHKGSINYVPWTGPGCTGLYWECPGAAEPETWGSIKAMFR
ncbi:MAG: right-handed parallel beta-helix repeat-containing protein [Candidatus Eisenbacteria bacterium]